MTGEFLRKTDRYDPATRETSGLDTRITFSGMLAADAQNLRLETNDKTEALIGSSDLSYAQVLGFYDMPPSYHTPPQDCPCRRVIP